jgi:uncharacterized protein YxeA
MTFCLSWVYHESGFLSSTLIIIITLITLLFAALLIWYRRNKLTDLSYLLKLNHELQAE